MNKILDIKRILLIIAILALSAQGGFSQSSYDILRKAAVKIEAAKGVQCSFTLKSGEHSTDGTLKSQGERFHLQTPVSTTWYDGSRMLVLNPSTHETTLYIPDTEEVLEVNPMAYLRNFSKDYFSAFSKKKADGKHIVLLNPRKKGGQIRAIEITVDATTFLPEKFIVRTMDNKRTYLTIRSLRLDASYPSSTFTYPASSYKDYMVIDLR